MISTIGPGTLLMFAGGGVLIYLAIAKKYEPMLLLPIGFGVLLGNLPDSPLNHPGGMLYLLNEFGIQTELLPLFIFIGIGAMMDFRHCCRSRSSPCWVRQVSSASSRRSSWRPWSAFR